MRSRSIPRILDCNKRNTPYRDICSSSYSPLLSSLPLLPLPGGGETVSVPVTIVIIREYLFFVFIEKKEEGDENTNFFNLNSYFFNHCKLT